MRVPNQQAILVTGASKGIGRALVEHFVSAGAQVAGASRAGSDYKHERYMDILCDVADEKSIIAMIKSVMRRFGRLDCVVNNAGIASMNHSLMMPAATFDRIMSTNARGTFIVSREAAKAMRKNGGRIVNMSTIAVPMSLEGEAAYAASKSAVETLTRVMARELAPFGVTVNAVGPTPIETDLIRNVPKDKIAAIVDRLAVKRLGRLEDVINVVDFFLSPQSDYITGQVLYLGGA